MSRDKRKELTELPLIVELEFGPPINAKIKIPTSTFISLKVNSHVTGRTLRRYVLAIQKKGCNLAAPPNQNATNTESES
jgi:hypothetical protein